MKILTLLLILVFVVSISYANTFSIRVDNDKRPIQIDSKYDRLRGVLLIASSIYFAYVANRMSQGARFEEGDVELVGTLFAISSVPLFVWGVSLAF